MSPREIRMGSGERKPHNEQLHSSYCSSNIGRVKMSRRLRWAGLLARIEEGRICLKILTTKPTGKRAL